MYLMAGDRPGTRPVSRIVKDRGVGAFLNRPEMRRSPVLLVGAGDGAELFIRAMASDPGAGYRVAGLVDDKGTRVGRQIHGLNVMGSLATLAEAVEKLTRQGSRPQRLIVTENPLGGARTRVAGARRFRERRYRARRGQTDRARRPSGPAPDDAGADRRRVRRNGSCLHQQRFR